MGSVNRDICAGSLLKLPGFFVGERMWPFGASHELRAIRRDLRILAYGNLILIERLKLMSAQTEAFKAALDGLLVRMDAAKADQADAEALRNQVVALQAELDEANAALVEGVSRMNADIPAEPQPDPEPVA